MLTNAGTVTVTRRDTPSWIEFQATPFLLLDDLKRNETVREETPPQALGANS
jgi:hypothetical protein